MDYLIVYWEILAMVFIFTGIQFFSVRREMGNDLEVRVFKSTLLTLMFAVCVDAVTHAQYKGFLHLPPLLVGLLYATYMSLIAGVLTFLWFLFAELRIKSLILRNTKSLAISAIPAALVVLMAFASIKTGWFFSVDDAGIYTRGKLWIVQNIIGYGYFLFTTVHAFKLAQTEPSPLKRRQYYSLALFLVAPFFGALLQLVIGNFPFVAPSVAIGLFFIFINIQGSMINSDTLTGLGNLKSAEKYIETKRMASSIRNPFYVYIIDLQDLKGINDNIVHSEGDRALRILANILKDATDNHAGFAARLGGEEFIAVIEAGDIEEPQSFEEELKVAAKKAVHEYNLPYNINLGIGYTKCDSPATSFNQLINAATRAMKSDI